MPEERQDTAFFFEKKESEAFIACFGRSSDSYNRDTAYQPKKTDDNDIGDLLCIAEKRIIQVKEVHFVHLQIIAVSFGHFL